MLEEQLKSRIEFLRNLRIFKKASDSELRDLASNLSDQVIHEGVRVFSKGDEANNLFIIAKGSVKIHDGEHILNIVGKGHVFGEYSLFHTHLRTASVTTLETTFLLKLSQGDFKSLLKKNPEIQMAVIESLVDTIAVQNQLEKELAEKKDELELKQIELEKAIRSKDRFFSLVAHDLRSPLSSLSSYLNLLINSNLLSREDITTYASEIQHSIENVVEMLNNLLNWAISETGEWQVKAEVFPIVNSITTVINLYRSLAVKRKITIENKTDDPDLLVSADRNSVDVILRNLVSNAIKYSPENSAIQLKAEKDGAFVTLSVRDYGYGMNEETIAKLFSIDIKNKIGESGNNSGTGLGLILSKEFAEKNKGSLYFESELNKGTVFYVKLPLAATP
jgi:signal transduction histidine kinase